MVQFLKRNIFQRLLGRCQTNEPKDPGSWSFDGGVIEVDLHRLPELSDTGAAVRLEGRDLPLRVLLVHADDGAFRAFHNKCAHAGRRLDPVPGDGTIQCCSMGKTTYDYEGKVVFGQVEDGVTPLKVSTREDRLIVELPPEHRAS